MITPNIWAGTTVNWATAANWSLILTPNSEGGTAQAGAGSTITLRAGASAVTDFYVGQVVFITSGTGLGQQRTISAYNGTTKVATVSAAWGVNPDNTSVYQVGDAVIFTSLSVVNVDGTAGSLDKSATLLSSLYIDASYSGFHGSSSAPLKIGADVVTIGAATGFGQNAGSARLYHDYGNTVLTTTINIISTSQASNEPSLPPYRFIGGGSTNPMTVNSQSGFWGIAAVPGETAYASINITAPPAQGVNPTQAYIGPGATIPTLAMQAGEVLNQSSAVMPSVTILGGKYNYIGTGGHTDLTVAAGATCTYAGQGNLTGSVNVSGTLDLSGNPTAKQITNGIKAYRGAVINLDNGQANITADGSLPVIVYLQQCDIADIDLRSGLNTVKLVRQ